MFGTQRVCGFGNTVKPMHGDIFEVYEIEGDETTTIGWGVSWFGKWYAVAKIEGEPVQSIYEGVTAWNQILPLMVEMDEESKRELVMPSWMMVVSGLRTNWEMNQ